MSNLTHEKVPEKEGWYLGWCSFEWLPMYYHPISSISCGSWFYDGVGVPAPECWAEIVMPDYPEDNKKTKDEK